MTSNNNRDFKNIFAQNPLVNQQNTNERILPGNPTNIFNHTQANNTNNTAVLSNPISNNTTTNNIFAQKNANNVNPFSKNTPTPVNLFSKPQIQAPNNLSNNNTNNNTNTILPSLFSNNNTANQNTNVTNPVNNILKNQTTDLLKNNSLPSNPPSNTLTQVQSQPTNKLNFFNAISNSSAANSSNNLQSSQVLNKNAPQNLNNGINNFNSNNNTNVNSNITNINSINSNLTNNKSTDINSNAINSNSNVNSNSNGNLTNNINSNSTTNTILANNNNTQLASNQNNLFFNQSNNANTNLLPNNTQTNVVNPPLNTTNNLNNTTNITPSSNSISNSNNIQPSNSTNLFSNNNQLNPNPNTNTTNIAKNTNDLFSNNTQPANSTNNIFSNNNQSNTNNTKKANDLFSNNTQANNINPSNTTNNLFNNNQTITNTSNINNLSSNQQSTTQSNGTSTSYINITEIMKDEQKGQDYMLTRKLYKQFEAQTQKFNSMLEQRFMSHKLLLNLQFYKKNTERDNYYDTHILKNAQNKNTLGMPMSCFGQRIAQNNEEAIKLFDKIITKSSEILQTDRLLVYYLTIEYLRTTNLYVRWLQPKSVLSESLNLRELQKYCQQSNQNVQLNQYAPQTKQFLESLIKLFIEDRRLLLNLISEILTNKSLDRLRNKLIKEQIRLKMWGSYKSSPFVGDRFRQIDLKFEKLAHKAVYREQFKLSKLLYISTQRYHQEVVKDLNFVEVLDFLDKQNFSGSNLSQNQDREPEFIMRTQIGLILNLIPLKELERKIIDNYHCETKSWKEIYTSLKNATSHYLLPFKQLLPIMNKNFDIQKQQHHIQSQPNFKMLKFLMESQDWKSWLEIWIYSDKNFRTATEAEIEFTISIAKNVLKDRIEQYWQGKHFKGIQKFFQSLLKKNSTKHIFNMSINLLGTIQQEPRISEIFETFKRSSKKRIMKEQIYNPIYVKINEKNELRTLNRQGNNYLYNPLKFLCKCVTLNPQNIEQIQQNLIDIRQTTQSQLETGFYLILFILDAFHYYKTTSNYKIIKQLIRALTALLKTHSKKVGICISLKYWENPQDGSIFQIMDKLKQKSGKQEIQLQKVLVQHLIAILSIQNFQQLFPLKEYFNFNRPIDLQYQKLAESDIKKRFYNVYNHDKLNSLLLQEVGISIWLKDILRSIQFEVGSKSLIAINMILKKFECLSNIFSVQNEYLLFEFTETINRIRLDLILINNLSVVSNEEAMNIAFLSLQSKKWNDINYTNYQQRLLLEAEIKDQILNTLAVLQTIVTLVNIMEFDGTHLEICRILRGLQALNTFAKILNNKNNIYHYETIEFGAKGEKKSRVNLIFALACYLTFSQNHRIKETFNSSLNLSWSGSTSELKQYEQMLKNFDPQVLQNCYTKPLTKLYELFINIESRVLRILTNLVLGWKNLSESQRPRLELLLSQKNVQFADKAAHENLNYLFRILEVLLKKLTTVGQTYYLIEKASILDFLCVCVKYEPRVMAIIKQPLVTTLNKFIQRVMHQKWSSRNLNIVQKTTMFLRLLLNQNRHQTSLKNLNCILNDDNLPTILLQGMNKYKPENLHVQSLKFQVNSLFNICYERQIMEQLLQYSIFEMACEIIVYFIFRNKNIYLSKLKDLYTTGFSTKLMQIHLTSKGLYQKLFEENSADKLQTHPQLTFKQKYTFTEDEFISNFVQMSLFNYGYNYSIDLIEYSEMLKKNKLDAEKVQQKVRMLKKYNIVKSYEQVKWSALEKWTHLFVVLCSVGSEGYSLSSEMEDQKLAVQKVQSSFGEYFTLANSASFRIKYPIFTKCQSIDNENSYHLCNFLTDTIQYFWSFTQQLNEEELDQMIKLKAKLLLCASNVYFKISSDKKQIKLLLTKLIQILQDIRLNAKHLLNEIEVVSLFSQIIILCQSHQVQHVKLIQFALYENQDQFVTSNIILGSVIQSLKHLKDNYVFKDVIERILSSVLSNNEEGLHIIIGMRVIVQLAQINFKILMNTQIVEKLIEHLTQCEHIVWKNNLLSKWILVLIQSLLANQTNQRIISVGFYVWLQKFKPSFQDLCPKSQQHKIRLALQDIDGMHQILKIVALTFQIRLNWRNQFSRLIQEYFELLLNNTVFSNLNLLIYFTAHEQEEKHLESIKLKEFKNTKNDTVIDQEINLYAFICKVQFISCIRWYLQSLSKGLQHSKLFTDQQTQSIACEKLSRFLPFIEKYLIQEYFHIARYKAQISDLLDLRKAYLISTEQSMRNSFLNIFKVKYGYEEYVQYICKILEKYYRIAISFAKIYSNIQNQTEKIKNFRKKLLYNIVKLADHINKFQQLSQQFGIKFQLLKQHIESKL